MVPIPTGVLSYGVPVPVRSGEDQLIIYLKRKVMAIASMVAVKKTYALILWASVILSRLILRTLGHGLGSSIITVKQHINTIIKMVIRSISIDIEPAMIRISSGLIRNNKAPAFLLRPCLPLHLWAFPSVLVLSLPVR